MSKTVKQGLTLALKIGFALGLIYWLIEKKVLEFSYFQQLATPGFLLVMAVLIFLMLFLNNLRWLWLMQAQGLPVTIRSTFPLSLIGVFFNYAVPGGVGGDVVKGFYVLQEHPTKKMAAAVSIFLDRITGLFVMILTASIALLFNLPAVMDSPQFTAVALGVVSFLVLFLIFFAITFSRRVQGIGALNRLLGTLPGGKTIRQALDGLLAYRHKGPTLLKAVGVSLCSQLLMILFVILIGHELHGPSLPLSAYFFLVPIGFVVTALPISPAGIGVGQAAFYYLFSLYLGKESAVGPTAITAVQIIQFAWGLLGAYFYLTRKKPKALETSENNEDALLGVTSGATDPQR